MPHKTIKILFRYFPAKTFPTTHSAALPPQPQYPVLKTTSYEEVTRLDSARTLAGRGRYWTTAYLVDGLLIDTGCAHSANELIQQLKNEKLALLVNTHSHEDHIGANGILQAQRPKLKIFAHPCALPVLEHPRKAQPLQPYRRILWGWPLPSTGRPIQDGDWLETEKYRFQALFTPGHSPDHLCLYEPARGWLFSGDLFVGGKDRALRVDYDIWQIIASLKRVVDLPLTKLFPGCARVRDNPQQALTEKIAYLEETGQKVLEYYQKGMSVHTIARALFGGPLAMEYITWGHFTRRGLVNSYLNNPAQQ